MFEKQCHFLYVRLTIIGLTNDMFKTSLFFVFNLLINILNSLNIIGLYILPIILLYGIVILTGSF